MRVRMLCYSYTRRLRVKNKKHSLDWRAASNFLAALLIVILIFFS